MYYKCCVSNCESTRQDAILHKFPCDKKRAMKWIKCMRDDADSIQRSSLKNLFICQKHFEKKFIGKSSKLLCGAYPTLFTPDEIISGNPIECDDVVDTEMDHTYARIMHFDHTYSAEAISSTSDAGGTSSSNVYGNQSTTLHCQDMSQPGSSYMHERPTPTRDVVTDHKWLERPSLPVLGIEVSSETPTLIDAGGTSSSNVYGNLSPTLHCQDISQLGSSYMHERPTPTRDVVTDHKWLERPSLPVLGIEVSSETPTLIDAGGTSSSNVYGNQSTTLHCQDMSQPGSSYMHERPTPTRDVVTDHKWLERPSLPVLRIEVSSETPTLIDDTSAMPAMPVNLGITTTPTVKKSCRKRIIHKLKNLTPTCRKLYKEFSKAKKQADFQRRARKALKFNKDNCFETMTKKMNPYARKFLEMQINLCTKKKKGRRFSLDEKLISLAIMKQGPKCYRFLHKIFILPSTSTLNKMVSNLNIEPGINKQFFTIVKKEVEKWPESKKHCSIIYDEMSLSMGLSYNAKNDQINGFVQLNDRKKRFADHVLVFMARGAVHKWQQPLAYYFCEGATSGPELKNILKKIVPAVAETGLNPIVLGCDQGSAFQSAIKSLQQDTRRDQLLRNQEPDDTVIIGPNKLNVIYDPSHLIKGIRNNFLTKDIKSYGKISRWQDIIDVYNTDCSHSDMRLLHKLNDEHVIPTKVKKMKVKNCVRVLSKTVAAALSYTSQFATYADGTPVSKTLQNTAETVSYFDDLFDSINGATTSMKTARGKALRTAVRESSRHHEFWLESIKKLEDMKFIDKGLETTVPTLKNFITTLKSYMKLWQVFKEKNLKIMRPRYFNTDPIENFFGQTRAYNYRNNDPTCHSFISTFKALTITRVIKFHSESYNCEDDQAEQLVQLKSLFDETKNQEEVVALPGNPSNVNVRVTGVEGMLEQARRERLSIHSRAYTTGWAIRKIFDKMPDCTRCKSGLTSSPEDSTHSWVSHREYKETIRKRKLNYPSPKAVRYFGMILDHTNECLEESCHKTKLINNIKKSFSSKHSIELVDCPEHQDFVAQYLLTIAVRLAVFNWCNRLNKILKGVDIVRLKEGYITNIQLLALNKYKKKLKNKSFNK